MKLVSAEEARDRNPGLQLEEGDDSTDNYLLRLNETVLALEPIVEWAAKQPCQFRLIGEENCAQCPTCQARARIKGG